MIWCAARINRCCCRAASIAKGRRENHFCQPYRSGADAAELYRRMIFNILISNGDDHLRNHGFLWVGRNGWTLSPAYDLNPTPADVRQRILSTSISLDDATCDLDLARSVAAFFGLSATKATGIIKQAAATTVHWRDVAAACDAPPAEIRRMESAFEHADLTKALAL